jgi:uncharacterized protein (DUF1778 family)
MPAKVERLEARITSRQKQLLQRAADLEGRSLSDFVVTSAQAAARRLILEHRLVGLSSRDSEAFARVLLSPPAPNAALRAAANRFSGSRGRP